MVGRRDDVEVVDPDVGSLEDDDGKYQKVGLVVVEAVESVDNRPEATPPVSCPVGTEGTGSPWSRPGGSTETEGVGADDATRSPRTSRNVRSESRR